MTMQISMLAILLAVGHEASLGRWYAAGLLGGAVLFAYQQWLIRDRERSACFRAFLNNHWFGAVIFAGIALDTWLS